jgi:hypothetical protein
MKTVLAAIVAIAVLALAPGCGDSGGCLSRAEVEQQVNDLAMGFETSSEEVEAKQEEIQDIRERQCESGQ